MKMFIVSLFSAAVILPVFAKASILPLPIKSFASLPFGGYVTSFIPCTCPPFGLAINYKPLLIGKILPTGVLGSLYYQPKSTRLYAWFAPFGPIVPGTPSTWNLGMYTPGDIGECTIEDPAVVAAGDADPCEPGIPVPTFGTINFMGSSMAGALAD